MILRQEMLHRGFEVILAQGAVEYSVEPHGVKPRKLVLILDAGDADEPGARGVLLLAGPEEAPPGRAGRGPG